MSPVKRDDIPNPENGNYGNHNGLTGKESPEVSASAGQLSEASEDNVLNAGSEANATDYNSSQDVITISLTPQVNAGDDAAGDKLSHIEKITGSDSIDLLTGDSGFSELGDGAGNDELKHRADDKRADDNVVDLTDYSLSFYGVVVDLETGAGVNGNVAGGDDMPVDRNREDIPVRGPSFDIADNVTLTEVITITLKNEKNFGEDAPGDALSGIEDVFGSAFGDMLPGNDHANIPSGYLGDDRPAAGGE